MNLYEIYTICKSALLLSVFVYISLSEIDTAWNNTVNVICIEKMSIYSNIDTRNCSDSIRSNINQGLRE